MRIHLALACNWMVLYNNVLAFPNKTSRLPCIATTDLIATTTSCCQRWASKEPEGELDAEECRTAGNGRRNFLQQGTSLAGGTGTVFVAGSYFPVPRATAMEEPRATTQSRDSLNDVKVALWGFGNQNKLMAKYLHDRKVPIVAVISHHDVGKDYTAVDLGRWGKKIGGRGVKIVDQDQAAAALQATRPDICIVCTRSVLKDLVPSLKVCAQCKVNVITIAEELVDSRTSSPELTREMDMLFRANGVTLTGSGFEEVAVTEMLLTMSSMMHRIDAIEGADQYNLNDYGAALAEEHGAGMTLAQFQTDMIGKEKEVGTDPELKQSIFANFMDSIASSFHLTRVGAINEVQEPMVASVPTYSAALGREIATGDVTGSKVTVIGNTKEGIRVSGTFIGKCYLPNECDYSTWGFQGEPTGVKFTMENVPSPQMTNTAAISRVLQVVNAPAGYVTVDELPAIPPYKHW